MMRFKYKLSSRLSQVSKCLFYIVFSVVPWLCFNRRVPRAATTWIRTIQILCLTQTRTATTTMEHDVPGRSQLFLTTVCVLWVWPTAARLQVATRKNIWDNLGYRFVSNQPFLVLPLGIRVLDGPLTDSLEAIAFNKHYQINDIYSCR